jgi:hypothetical protein
MIGWFKEFIEFINLIIVIKPLKIIGVNLIIGIKIPLILIIGIKIPLCPLWISSTIIVLYYQKTIFFLIISIKDDNNIYHFFVI